MTDVAGQGVTLPAPRTPDPQQAPPLRWGLLGAGWIADKFVTSLRAHTTQIPYAVWAPRPLAAAAAQLAEDAVARARRTQPLATRDGGRQRGRRLDADVDAAKAKADS